MGESKVKAWKTGTGPVRKEPSQSPSALLPALSHGVLEKGAGWPDWLARPWGQREGPAQPGEPLPVLLPGPPLPRPRAGNVLFPPLPPRGQRAGRAGRCPTLFSSSPPPPRPGASRRHHHAVLRHGLPRATRPQLRGRPQTPQTEIPGSEPRGPDSPESPAFAFLI